MSDNFVYVLAPTDFFFPFKTVEQALKDFDAECNGSEFISKCVEGAKAEFKRVGWEGDGKFYISGLPGDDCDAVPLILVMVKQENNGTTFLCSPVELPYLRDYSE